MKITAYHLLKLGIVRVYNHTTNVYDLFHSAYLCEDLIARLEIVIIIKN